MPRRPKPKLINIPGLEWNYQVGDIDDVDNFLAELSAVPKGERGESWPVEVDALLDARLMLTGQ